MPYSGSRLLTDSSRSAKSSRIWTLKLSFSAPIAASALASPEPPAGARAAAPSVPAGACPASTVSWRDSDSGLKRNGRTRVSSRSFGSSA